MIIVDVGADRENAAFIVKDGFEDADRGEADGEISSAFADEHLMAGGFDVFEELVFLGFGERAAVSADIPLIEEDVADVGA